MKLSAAREDLLGPLQSVIGVVERRQTMPVLANVLLAARDNKLSVTGTDLEVELVATTQVNVAQSGDITVPGRKLLEIIRSLPEKTSVTLTTDGERISLRAGRGIPAGGGNQRAADAQSRAGRVPPPDRQDALLDGAAGRALLPQRAPARDRRQGVARGGHRWPTPGARGDGARREGQEHSPGDRPPQGCPGAP